MQILINKLQDEVQKLREQLLNGGNNADQNIFVGTPKHHKRNMEILREENESLK